MDAGFGAELPGGTWPGPDLGGPEGEQRLRVLLRVAERHRAPMSLGQVVAHMPLGTAWTADHVASWVDDHPDSGQVIAGHVMPLSEIPIAELADRSARSAALIAEAEQAVREPLERAARLTRCIGVSGSVAYGFAAPADDLDFFVAARADATWVFLLLTFAKYRWLRWRRGSAPPAHWCFNYVVDEREAAQSFSTEAGLLVAREALTLRVLEGEEYYRSLLRASPWMGAELPRLYAQRRGPPTGSDPPAGRTSLWVRVANRVVFPLLAAYLQAAGLVRNHRLRRTAPERQFATRTSYRAFLLRSLHFAELTHVYRSVPSDRVTPAAGDEGRSPS